MSTQNHVHCIFKVPKVWAE
jgi:hypothetical protein